LLPAVQSFLQPGQVDGSIRQLLSDLQNSVLTAVILVFIVILYALSGRASLLIGFAIPTSFLMGILALSLAG
jgi:multidrug efflux pump